LLAASRTIIVRHVGTRSSALACSDASVVRCAIAFVCVCWRSAGAGF